MTDLISISKAEIVNKKGIPQNFKFRNFKEFGYSCSIENLVSLYNRLLERKDEISSDFAFDNINTYFDLLNLGYFHFRNTLLRVSENDGIGHDGHYLPIIHNESLYGKLIGLQAKIEYDGREGIFTIEELFKLSSNTIFSVPISRMSHLIQKIGEFYKF